MSRPSTHTPWGIATAGLALGCLVSAMVFAPARWLAHWVQTLSLGQVVLSDARGTVWRGSARLTLTGGVGSHDASTLPGRLAWVVSPSLSGGNVQLQADCCMPQATMAHIQPLWGGLQVSLADHRSQWPAQLLAGLGTPWNTILAQGDLVLSTRELAITHVAGRLLLTGQAQLDIMNMSSHLSTVRPMGSYRVTLTGGASPTLTLATLQGSLQLSGSGQWVGGKLRFNGEASALPDHLDALSNLLNIIGKRNGPRAMIKVG